MESKEDTNLPTCELDVPVEALRQEWKEPSKSTQEEIPQPYDNSTDLEDPLSWSPTRRWVVVSLLCCTNLVASICSTGFEPALPFIMDDFGVKSNALSSLTISIYVIGYVFGPLFIAPMSEVYGRVAVLYPAYVVYLVSLAICGTSNNLALFTVFRAIMGFAGITFVIGGPAVIADIIPKERRGLALNIMSMGPMLGPTFGPVIGGYIAETIGWRWIFWISIIALGVLAVAALVVLRETYPPVLLLRRQAQSQHASENKPKPFSSASPTDPNAVLRAAFVRPVKMLFSTPIIPLFAIYTSILNSYLFILFATLGTVFESAYGFSAGSAGLVYFGLSVGFLFSEITLALHSDAYVQKMEARHGVSKPEYRLPPLIIGSLLLPIGFLWYGWSIAAHTHWIVPIAGSAVVAIGAMYSYMPVQMYVVDAYTVYAASANGALSIVRSACAAVVPLGANPLYARLGYGWGNSLLAFIAMPFVLFAMVLLRYGERIRTHPKWQPEL